MCQETVKYLTATYQLHLIKHVNNISTFHDEEYYHKIELTFGGNY